MAIGISLTSRTNSTVAIEKETSRNARTVDAETVGSDPETRSTNALSIAQDLVRSAAGNAVLGRIDVSIGANLAHTIDSTKTFEAATGVSGSTEDFVSTGAAIDTEAIAENLTSIAITSSCGSIIGGSNWTSHAVAVKEEIHGRTKIADSLTDSIARFALASLGGCVDDLVDSTGGYAPLLVLDPDLAFGTA